MPPRPRVEPTDDWHKIALLVRAPGQRTYELIRSVVLFGQSPAERAAETGTAERLPCSATPDCRHVSSMSWRGVTLNVSHCVGVGFNLSGETALPYNSPSTIITRFPFSLSW